MPHVSCRNCSKHFYKKPSGIKAGEGKYCSMRCKRIGQHTGRSVECFICRKEVYKSGKALRISKSGKHFCSKSCQTIWRNSMVYIGPRHPNWKDGRGRDSYRSIIRRSEKIQECILCKIIDKRVLAVHHIDHDHFNNDIRNLAWLCHNCHYLVHHAERERERFMADVA